MCLTDHFSHHLPDQSFPPTCEPDSPECPTCVPEEECRSMTSGERQATDAFFQAQLEKNATPTAPDLPAETSTGGPIRPLPGTTFALPAPLPASEGTPSRLHILKRLEDINAGTAYPTPVWREICEEFRALERELAEANRELSAVQLRKIDACIAWTEAQDEITSLRTLLATAEKERDEAKRRATFAESRCHAAIECNAQLNSQFMSKSLELSSVESRLQEVRGHLDDSIREFAEFRAHLTPSANFKTAIEDAFRSQWEYLDVAFNNAQTALVVNAIAEKLQPFLTPSASQSAEMEKLPHVEFRYNDRGGSPLVYVGGQYHLRATVDLYMATTPTDQINKDFEEACRHFTTPTQ
jgi:hypothetical protein